MAKIFKDTQGQSWRLALNVGTLRNIKDQLDIDLLNKPGDMPTELSGIVDCLWVALFDQTQARGMTEQDFAECLDGDVLAVAVDDFMAELAAFFLKIQPSKAMAIKGIWEKTKDLEKMQQEAVTTMLGSVSIDLQE